MQICLELRFQVIITMSVLALAIIDLLLSISMSICFPSQNFMDKYIYMCKKSKFSLKQTHDLSKTEVHYYQYKSHNESKWRILSEHRLRSDSPISSIPCNSASSLPTCISSNHPSAARSSPSHLCLTSLPLSYDQAFPRDAPLHRCSFA